MDWQQLCPTVVYEAEIIFYCSRAKPCDPACFEVIPGVNPARGSFCAAAPDRPTRFVRRGLHGSAPCGQPGASECEHADASKCGLNNDESCCGRSPEPFQIAKGRQAILAFANVQIPAGAVLAARIVLPELDGVCAGRPAVITVYELDSSKLGSWATLDASGAWTEHGPTVELAAQADATGVGRSTKVDIRGWVSNLTRPGTFNLTERLPRRAGVEHNVWAAALVVLSQSITWTGIHGASEGMVPLSAVALDTTAEGQIFVAPPDGNQLCETLATAKEETCSVMAPLDAGFILVRVLAFSSQAKYELMVRHTQRGYFDASARFGAIFYRAPVAHTGQNSFVYSGCLSGADTGYWAGDFCGECQFRYTGGNCNSYYSESTECAVWCAHGECVLDATTGNRFEKCQCLADYYGLNCDKYCTKASCSGRGTCNILTGQRDCFRDKVNGFWGTPTGGTACTVCLSGYWGSECRELCTCRYGICSVLTGRCTTSSTTNKTLCQARRTGADCDQCDSTADWYGTPDRCGIQWHAARYALCAWLLYHFFVMCKHLRHSSRRAAACGLDGTWQLYVKGLDGKTDIVPAEPRGTVADLLQAVELRYGMKATRVRLIHQGRQLIRGRRLSDFNIQQESTLHLMLRLPGGMPPRRKRPQQHRMDAEVEVPCKHCKLKIGLVQLHPREVGNKSASPWKQWDCNKCKTTHTIKDPAYACLTWNVCTYRLCKVCFTNAERRMRLGLPQESDGSSSANSEHDQESSKGKVVSRNYPLRSECKPLWRRWFRHTRPQDDPNEFEFAKLTLAELDHWQALAADRKEFIFFRDNTSDGRALRTLQWDNHFQRIGYTNDFRVWEASNPPSGAAAAAAQGLLEHDWNDVDMTINQHPLQSFLPGADPSLLGSTMFEAIQEARLGHRSLREVYNAIRDHRCGRECALPVRGATSHTQRLGWGEKLREHPEALFYEPTVRRLCLHVVVRDVHTKVEAFCVLTVNFETMKINEGTRDLRNLFFAAMDRRRKAPTALGPTLQSAGPAAVRRLACPKRCSPTAIHSLTYLQSPYRLVCDYCHRVIPQGEDHIVCWNCHDWDLHYTCAEKLAAEQEARRRADAAVGAPAAGTTRAAGPARKRRGVLDDSSEDTQDDGGDGDDGVDGGDGGDSFGGEDCFFLSDSGDDDADEAADAPAAPAEDHDDDPDARAAEALSARVEAVRRHRYRLMKEYRDKKTDLDYRKQRLSLMMDQADLLLEQPGEVTAEALPPWLRAACRSLAESEAQENAAWPSHELQQDESEDSCNMEELLSAVPRPNPCKEWKNLISAATRDLGAMLQSGVTGEVEEQQRHRLQELLAEGRRRWLKPDEDGDGLPQRRRFSDVFTRRTAEATARAREQIARRIKAAADILAAPRGGSRPRGSASPTSPGGAPGAKRPRRDGSPPRGQ